jgi:hypothetical protein
VQGTHWTAATDNDTTAESLKTAIHALTEVNCTRADAIDTVEAATAGTAGNALGLVTSYAAAVAVGAATLAGAEDGVTLEIDAEDSITEGIDFFAITSNDVTAAAIAEAINTIGKYAAVSSSAVVTVNYLPDYVTATQMAITSSDDSVTVAAGGQYSANDVVGGLLSISNVIGNGAKKGAFLLRNIVLSDKANLGAATDVILFNANPSASTFVDNAALAIAAADSIKVIGCFNIATGDYFALGSQKVAVKTGLSLIGELEAATQDLYFVVVTRGTPTYVNTNDLQIIFGLEEG